MISLKDKIIVEAKRADEGWGRAYPLFCRVLNEYGLKTGVEVGVAFGGHAEAMLQQTLIQKLYGVDPYRHFRDYDDPMNLPQAEFDALFEFTKCRLAVFGDRFEARRETSSEATSAINVDIDFVYIDALHTYEGVRDDVRNWYSKVRYGGVIGGHDYGHSCFPGVKKAVDEFFSRFGLEVHDEGEGVWWVEKQRINISYFMPAYNCADTIKESVESIMADNFADGDELVIVDDGSTDSTADVLIELQNTYDSVTVLRHFSNRGGGAARNTAIAACKHHVLFCLDSDNVLESASIGNLKQTFENSGADVVSFQELHFFVSDTRKIDFKWQFKPGWLTINDHLSSKMVPGASGNYMFTKESWLRAGGYPEFAGALDTFGFGLRQIFTGAKMYVLPGTFYYHRTGHESYWMRDAERRKCAMSLIALQLLLPFSDMIDESYLDYIMSRKGRYTWFHNLKKRPIRLVHKQKKLRVWDSEPQKTKCNVQRIKNRLKQSVKSLIDRFAVNRQGDSSR